MLMSPNKVGERLTGGQPRFLKKDAFSVNTLIVTSIKFVLNVSVHYNTHARRIKETITKDESS